MNRKDSPGILIDRATETAPQGPSAAALLDGRVLGDRRFRVVLSASGTGFSSFEGVALTRWSGDRVEDDGGLLVYLRDLDSGAVWSVGRQPMGWPADHCGVEWTPGAAILTSRNAGIEARMEVCVAPGAPAELRRITLKNLSDHARRLDLTTCTEPVLQDSAADEAHPAFSKLFIQTEAVPALAALLARRRPRANGENHPWLVHGLQGEGPLEWETDRARFLGRGRETSSALSLEAREGLSGTVGNVLDPVMCLRRPVRLAPGATVRFDVLLGAGSDREQSLQMVSKFGSHAAVDQAFDAAAGAAALVREIAVDREEELRLEHLAFALLAGHPGLRAGRAVLERIRHVPGPSPSPLVRAREIAVVVSFGARVDPDRAAETLRACRYWNALGVPAKPVWIADEFSPIEEDLASGAVRQERARLQRGEEDRLAAAAPLYLASNESLADAHRRVLERDRSAVPGMRLQAPQPGIEHGAEDDFFSEELRLFNGHGGFNPASNEYVIRMPLQRNGRLRLPPLPWVNVIANEDFGCLVSETGSGCTWSGNSREHRLTPWRNDPLRDPADEALYLRDEVTGEVWCPLPGPAPAAGPFEMRHGFGYSCCRHRRGTLDMETTIFVPRHHSAKVSILKITNRRGGAASFHHRLAAPVPG